MKITKNTNKEYVEEIERRLKENDNYCPCQLEKNKDTKCMCKLFRDAIKNKQYGECHCGYYVLKE